MPEPRVYASPETHHVVTRAMGVLGLGRANIRMVGLDGGRRADLGQLSAIREDLAAGRTPIAIVGNAGDVNTGIVDPLPEMAEIAAEHDIWFHVDGAYGGLGMLDERVESAYGDRASYDSFAVDPHKWLAAPVGTGLAVCRDGVLLSRAFTIEPGHYDSEFDLETDDDGSDASPSWVSAGSARPTGVSISPHRPGACPCGPCSRRWAPTACVRESVGTTTTPASWPTVPAPSPSWSCSQNRSSPSPVSATGRRLGWRGGC